jgi:hypothetical protein
MMVSQASNGGRPRGRGVQWRHKPKRAAAAGERHDGPDHQEVSAPNGYPGSYLRSPTAPGLMGAVIVGPWDGATEPKVEHDDEVAEHNRKWAAYLEELLEEHDQSMIPVSRESVEKLTSIYRDREQSRLDQLERLHPKDDPRQLRELQERVDYHREVSDRMVHKLVALEKQVRRARRGTALETLPGLDAKTCGVLWTAGIATVEEFVQNTQRPNWLIRGVGPKRRTEIIEALKSAPNEEEE